MSIAYDPFKWADNWESEEEFLQELIKEERKRKNDLLINNRAGTSPHDQLS